VKDNAADLGKEATAVNHAFLGQVLDMDADAQRMGDEPAPNGQPLAYRYLAWTLAKSAALGGARAKAEAQQQPSGGDDDASASADDEDADDADDDAAAAEDPVRLVVRTRVEARSTQRDGPQLTAVRAFHEYDPKLTMNWRKTLDVQRGAVLATELKNNSLKSSRWVSEALLAGVPIMLLGFVSRIHPSSPSRHTILGTQFYKTSDLAKQLGLRMSNMWGILRRMVRTLLAQPEGDYVLLRDPNKNIVRLYKQ